MHLFELLFALPAILYLTTSVSSFVLPCGSGGHSSSCRMALHADSGKFIPSFKFTLNDGV